MAATLFRNCSNCRRSFEAIFLFCPLCGAGDKVIRAQDLAAFLGPNEAPGFPAVPDVLRVLCSLPPGLFRRLVRLVEEVHGGQLDAETAERRAEAFDARLAMLFRWAKSQLGLNNFLALLALIVALQANKSADAADVAMLEALRSLYDVQKRQHPENDGRAEITAPAQQDTYDRLIEALEAPRKL